MSCLDPDARQTKIVKNQPVTSLTFLLLSLKNMIQAPRIKLLLRQLKLLWLFAFFLIWRLRTEMLR